MSSNISILDSASAAQVVKTTDTASVHTPHHNVDAVIPGTGATNLGKAEDAAHSSGDVGVAAMSVRQDTAAALAGTDADYQPLITDGSGRLHVNVGNTVTVGSHAVTNAGTFAVQVSAQVPGTGATNLGKAEDAAHTSGDVGVMALGVRYDAGGTLSSADGDYTPLQVDANGALRVTGGGGGTEYTEDAAAAANPVGTATILVRKDTPAGIASADGDNVAQRGTDYGAAYVQLVTSAGAYIDSVGGGTEYTEDAAAAANPLGKATILVRADTPAGVASADGDNVAQRGTDYGAAYATLLTAGGVPIATGSGNATGTLRVELPTNGTGVIATVGAVTAITNALPAGTNAIGKLAANSGVDIGDTDVTSIIPGTGATNLGKAIDTATGSTDTGVLALATRDDALSSLTPAEGDCVQLRTDANGALWVIPSGTLTVASHAVTNAGTFAVQAACTNAGTFAVQAACTNAGTFAVQVDGSALTALQKIDDPVLVDDAAFTPATSSVMMAGFEADESSTDSVDEGDAGAARMTLDRKIIVNPQPHTAGGLAIARDIDLDNSTLTVVKNAAGQLYGWDITNTTTATVFVKFYDATSGTLGTGTPVLTIGIPGNSSDDTLSSKMLPFGIAFATGICVGAGTGVADADNTDPGANGVVANIYYR